MLTGDSALAGGKFLAILSRLMNGVFTLPMRYLGRWSWENAWAVFVTVSCVLMPMGMSVATVSGFEAILRLAPSRVIVFPAVAGCA